jgi:hypothetical protein
MVLIKTDEWRQRSELAEKKYPRISTPLFLIPHYDCVSGRDGNVY